MSIAAKVAELLVIIRKQDLDELTPAERRTHPGKAALCGGEG